MNFSSEIEFDVDQVIQNFPDWSVEYFQKLDSTNKYFMEQAAIISPPAVVIAEEQTAGKGRGGNRWWSGRGALTFSFLVSPENYGIPRENYSSLSLVIPALLRETIVKTVGIEENRLKLKWPNDLYLDEKKLCGILLEQPGNRTDSLVIGIGINVNNSFDGSPKEVSEKAISLIDAANKTTSRTKLLASIMTAMLEALHCGTKRKLLFPDAWESSHLLDHRLITIEESGKVITGRCEGIDETGALILRDMYTVHRIHSAVILNWE